MPLQPASGARDLNPQQVESNQQLSKKLSDVYKIWGYEEVSPPIIERLETLMAGGAIDSKDIVRIVANESLGLRPEVTVSIARAACTRFSNRPRPLRLWTSGHVFRSRESVEGGLCIEEKLQSDVELFGVKSISGEMELLSLLLTAIEQLKLKTSNKPILLIGQTQIMDLILEPINNQYKEKARNYLLQYDRLNLENLIQDKDITNYLLEIQSIRGQPLDIIKALESKFRSNIVLENLKRIFQVIEPLALKYGINLQFDPTFQPHFELYTGIVFQFICNKGLTPLIIAQGGRYDKLIKKCGGDKTESTGLGFSISLDKIQEVKNYRHDTYTNQDSYLIAYGSNSSLEYALEAQKKLHERGFKAILELEYCKNKEDAINLLEKRCCQKLEWIN